MKIEKGKYYIVHKDGWVILKGEGDVNVRTPHTLDIFDTEAEYLEALSNLKEPETEEMPELIQPKAPEVITKAQGLIQLYNMGMYDQMIQALEGMTEIDKITFEATKEWEYNNRMIKKMVELFGFTEDDKRDFFIAASKIVV